MSNTSQKVIPPAAKWLGIAGLIPFVGLTLIVADVADLQHDQALAALVAYGALILTFLGGAQWGLSISEPDDRGATWCRLSISVLPSLVSWAALLMSSSAGLITLAISFAMVLIVDVAWYRQGRSPEWYVRLRIGLSLCVIACLVTTRLLF